MQADDHAAHGGAIASASRPSAYLTVAPTTPTASSITGVGVHAGNRPSGKPSLKMGHVACGVALSPGHRDSPAALSAAVGLRPLAPICVPAEKPKVPADEQARGV